MFKNSFMTHPSAVIATIFSVACVLSLCCITAPAYAWGDEGHEVIGLIADHYLDSAVRAKMNAILAGDKTGLTPSTQIDQEATWADKFRDSDRNTTKVHYNQTHNWHFVDLELEGPDLQTACFGRPALPKETPASLGPADDCVVDKIEEFTTELEKSTTSMQERRLALEFLLHFVGDIHQPLHASDDRDRSRNRVKQSSSCLGYRVCRAFRSQRDNRRTATDRHYYGRSTRAMGNRYRRRLGQGIFRCSKSSCIRFTARG